MPYNQPQEKFREVTETVQVIKAKQRLAEFKGEELVSFADAIGRLLSSQPVDLKTSQIRKFLDAVKSIRSRGVIEKTFDFRTEAMMMKPKLAYASGRADSRRNGVQPFMDVILPCIDQIYKQEDFEQLANFVEAIVAYHKYYGGKD
ncbi:MAG TPA: type III-A CRISPR-associated protein Csm2 [bacterium]|nr:type III-A CRISPR-associated protein Csm2 [bacterium]HNT67333.1 type III-A CRISPR-associated protein Csm2 [bacterium]